MTELDERRNRQLRQIIPSSRDRMTVPDRRGRLSLRGLFAYAGSTSMFLLATSSLVIRKLRTWPARTGSVFDVPAGAPLFQRSLSIELSEARSAAGESALAFSSPWALLAAVARHTACTPSPSSTRDSLPD